MSEEILINITPQETRVAVIQQGVVQEVQIERTSARGWVGNIYMGRVVRVLPGMQSAFVDIGGARAAFLHVADLWGQRQEGFEAKPIERLLAEGQNIMVQVIKDPIGTKGRGCRRRSASPDGCWSICRRNRISAFRSASRTKRSACTCARSCSS